MWLQKDMESVSASVNVQVNADLQLLLFLEIQAVDQARSRATYFIYN